MEYFEHKGKKILFYIEHDWHKPRGRNKTMVMFVLNFFSKKDSLRIPVNLFDKDFKTDEDTLKFIEKNIKKIELWLKKPKTRTYFIRTKKTLV